MDKWGYNNLIEQKKLWEKEELLVMSNFSFSHNVFNSSLVLMHQSEYMYLWSKGLIHVIEELITLQRSSLIPANKLLSLRFKPVTKPWFGV